jgi:EmrB/QacA subfamily drug resistance transporter
VSGAHPLAQKRWSALVLLCMGVLMIVLDTTIVNVALPSIQADLHFSETGLVWVVNAYLLTFGGLMLLGGRLGDLYGHRRLFVAGIILFTIASLGCGLANAQGLMVAGRAIQGVGGAVVSAVALSLIMNLFTEPADRAKAMGVYGFVCAGGGSLGVLLGGVLTSTLSWHWVFLVNLPLGVVICMVSMVLLPHAAPSTERPRLDVAGAIAITLSLMLAVYAIVNGNAVGWTTLQTLGLLGAAVVLFAIFLGIESHVDAPLVPLALFRLHNLSIANGIGMLWTAAMFAAFFISALYMQLVLGFSALQVGLAFFPSNLLMATFSLGLSARMVMRWGPRRPLCAGLLVASVGLLLFARAPVHGALWLDVMPGMLLLGLGAGMALNPLLLLAMDGVAPDQSGLASGVVNTSFMMGGALGLAVLASLADARTGALRRAGAGAVEALNGGYQLAFLVGAVCGLAAAALGWWLRPTQGSSGADTATLTH